MDDKERKKNFDVALAKMEAEFLQNVKREIHALAARTIGKFPPDKKDIAKHIAEGRKQFAKAELLMLKEIKTHFR